MSPDFEAVATIEVLLFSVQPLEVELIATKEITADIAQADWASTNW